MSSLHFTNALLCESERVGVLEDEKRSLNDISHSLNRLEDQVVKDAFIPNKIVGRAVKLIKIHHKLKYQFSNELRLRIVTVFLSAFQQKDKMQVSSRVKLLQILCIVLKRSSGPLGLKLDWKLYWDEYIDVCSRKFRHEISVAENVLTDFIKTYLEFLLVLRDHVDAHFPHQGLDSFQGEKNDWGSLVNYAMAKLAQDRTPMMFEGVSLLLALLPTRYAHYDELLPRWFSLWTSLDNNGDWEYCWITIMSRARKHAISFDWAPTLPYFLSIARDLMELPAGHADMVTSVQRSSFPKGMHSMHRNVVIASFTPDKDSTQKAIRKVTKLIMFLIQRDATLSKTTEKLQITLPSIVLDALAKRELEFAGVNASSSSSVGEMRSAAAELVLFLQSLRVFSHPSNSGAYVTSISTFLYYIVACLSKTFGENVAARICAEKEQGKDAKIVALDRSLVSSYDHLLGAVLTFTFEGLYSKSMAVCQRYNVILLELLALKPVYAHAVVPFFLAALDPQNSTQPHQSRTAIHALSRSLKTMLFPHPVVLPFLPEILKRALEFVHPSDAMKTTLVLDLVTNVFAWIPVNRREGEGLASVESSEKREEGAVAAGESSPTSFQSYLEFFGVKTSGGASILSATEVSAQLDVLQDFLQTEWVFLFLEKAFAIIDAQEKPVEGAKPSAVMDMISRVFGYLFQSVNWNAEGTFICELREKTLKYIISSAPPHTAKVCAKIIESLVCCSPSIMRDVLSRLITDDVRTAEGSAERIAFRLRVVGGCLRTAGSATILSCADLVTPLLRNTSFLCHEEQSVRQALAKLHKDLFKGCTASYLVSFPLSCGDNKTHNAHTQALLASPNVPSTRDLQWHTPTREDLVQATALVKETMMFLESQLRSALAAATATAAAEKEKDKEEALSVKRCEDMIGASLSVLGRVVRGVAELLSEEEHEDKEEQEEQGEGHALNALPCTGRETQLRDLEKNHHADTARYWRTLRHYLLALLIEIDDKLNVVVPAFRGLRDNEFIATQWMHCLVSLLTRRGAFIKDCSQASTALKMYKRAYRSQYVVSVYSALRGNSLFREELFDFPAENEFSLSSLSYWKFHDIPTNDVANRVWNQRSLRARVYANASLRHAARLEDESNAVGIALRKLLALARHEFDAIRPQARKAFEKIAGFLGHRIVVLLHELLLFLTKSDASYTELASSLVLLKQSLSMRKIATEYDLKERFLCAMVSVQRACASNVEELDKREKVMHSLADAFAKYTSLWQHTPRDLTRLQTQIVPRVLQSLGVVQDEQEHTQDSALPQREREMDVEGEDNKHVVSTPFVFTSNGLRLDMFLLYTLLHSVSSAAPHGSLSQSSLSVSQTSLWAVALQQLTEAQAQPVQSMAASMLCRLAEALLVSQQRFGDVANHVEIQSLFDSYGSSTKSGSSVDALVLGLTRANSRSQNDESQSGHGEGAQQWSRGVSSTLSASQYLQTVKPRSFSSKKYETNLCSAFFRKDVASLVYSLTASGFIVRGWARESELHTNTHTEDNEEQDEERHRKRRKDSESLTNSVCVTHLKNVLESLKNVPVTSESERRALNATKSEFVSGVLRRLFELIAHKRTQREKGGNGSERALANGERELKECECMLLQFVLQTLEPLSIDFARDWQEGLAFAFETHYSRAAQSEREGEEEELGPFASHVANSFANALSLACAPDAAVAASVCGEREDGSGTSGGEEGFTQHAKTLMLTLAVLHGDGTGKLFLGNAQDMVFAPRVARSLCAREVSLSLAYHALRVETCSVLSALLDYAPQSVDFVRGVAAKLLATLSPAEREKNEAQQEESETTSTTVDSDSHNTHTQSLTQTQQNAKKKHAIELAALIVRHGCNYLRLSQKMFSNFFFVLLPLLSEGLAHSDVDVVKSAGDAIKAAMLLVFPFTAMVDRAKAGFSVFGESPIPALAGLVGKYNDQVGTNWKVREFVHKLLTSFMMCNWFCLSNDERKMLKDLFAQGVNDTHAAVQEVAKDGMISYLCFKTGPELKTIADVYLRNSEALATREKQKKKVGKTNGSAAVSTKPDTQYWNVLQMISCVLQTSPYDLPAYLPALLVSFLRHAHYHDSSKQLIIKTMQTFQRTHQDRWEEEFKHQFTADQLQDLQGAGAAHYFA